MKFIVIGITDAPKPSLTAEVIDIVRQGSVFSGGRRHHDIVRHLLPSNAVWIDITVPLDHVFDQYQRCFAASSSHGPQPIIVFASGDPLFFGFANTIRRKMPDAEIVLYPSFNSLQMLAHRLVLPYHDMRIVSLTGRPWPDFDRALIERAPKMGVLTDREHTPAAIARRMMDYGYTGYVMHVGEHLGHPERERVTSLSLAEVSLRDFDYPNCLILQAVEQPSANVEQPSVSPHPPFGIPDNQFALLDGREKMITKMPIRLLTLQALDLPCRQVLWDVGFCTGSISIEARLHFPHLHIEAFEIRQEGEVLMNENCRRFGTPGIGVHIGDFLEADIQSLLHPDAVFIGGHGGRLKEIMQKILTCLAPDGIIVFNSVTSPKVHADSRQMWNDACRELDLRQEPPLRITLNDYNPIEILKCKR